MLSRRLLREKIVKEIYAQVQGKNDEIVQAEKELILSINRAYDLYFQLLTLLPEIVAYAQERLDIGKLKQVPTYEDLHPNTKFVNNRVARLISESETIEEYCKKKKLSWKGQEDLARNIFQNLRTQPFYEEYMSSEKNSLQEDVAVVAKIYEWLLEENSSSELLENILEEYSVFWASDFGPIMVNVIKTVRGIRSQSKEIKLLAEFREENDIEFAKKLFRASLRDLTELKDLISKYVDNWDVERLSLLDIIILSVAITEMKTFSDIPVKVTLNEFIDIAKYYSSPNSPDFVNGILDKISQQMLENGEIKKFGKGLL